MRTTAALVLTSIVALSLTPAVHAQRATTQLVGQWKLDNEETVAAMKKRGGEKGLLDFIKGFHIKVQFLQEGRCPISSDGPDDFRGKWRVLKEIPQKDATAQLDIELVQDGNDGDKLNARVKYLDKNTFQVFVRDPETMKTGFILFFNRAQKGK